MSIWTGRSRFGTDPTLWRGLIRTEKRSKTGATSAVEKAGAWKTVKTKSRFPPSPTLPWKSRRRREIPTFPPRRQRRLSSGRKRRQRPNQNPRRRPNGCIALFHKADRSRVNKSGQLDVLRTVDSLRWGSGDHLPDRQVAG